MTKLIFLSFLLVFVSRFSFAQNEEDSLNDSIKKHTSDTLSVKASLNLARQYIYREPEKALVNIDKAIALSEKQKFYRGLADAYVYKGAYYDLKNEYKSALKCYFLSLNNYNKAHDKRGVARGYSNIAMGYQRLTEFDKAIAYYEKAEFVVRQLDDSSGLANIYSNIALIQYDRGKLAEAMNYHIRALEIRESKSDLHGMASSYLNIGLIYESQNETQIALDYFHKSYRIHDTLNDIVGLADALNNIGTIYMENGDNDSALLYYPIALNHYENVGNPNGVSTVSQNVGSIYAIKGEYDKSIEYYLRAIEVLEFINEKQGLAHVYMNMGRSYAKLKQFETALNYVEKGIAITKETGLRDTEKTGYHALYDVYLEMKDSKNALMAYTRYIELRDSIFNLEVSGQLLDAEKKYESEKKQREIEKLATQIDIQQKADTIRELEIRKKEITNIFLIVALTLIGVLFIVTYFLFRNKGKSNLKLKEINAQLEVVNGELEIEKENMELKALLSQINPHFIFNSLNSVQKYIASNDKEQAFDYLSNFGKIMRSTLENSNESYIAISDELEVLRIYMDLEAKRIPGKLSYEFIVDEKLDIYNMKIPPMLLQPYIENAIWHGIMQKGSPGNIRIIISQVKESVHCSIEDDGIGRKRSAELKSTSDKKSYRSMGMSITEKRLETLWKKRQSHHKVVITDLVNEKNECNGTKVNLVIPMEF